MNQHHEDTPDAAPVSPDLLLSQQDSSALDQWIEQGWQASRDASADHRARAIGGLLDLLGTPIAAEHDRAARIDLTILRAARSRSGNTSNRELGPDDARAVDSWVNDDTAGTPEALADRIRTQEGLSALVSAGVPCSAEERDSRIERTLAAIHASDAARSERMKLQDAPDTTGWRPRLADIVSIAATLLIVASVAIPAVSGLQNQRHRLACESGMQQSARAMGVYAGDHADFLPMATAGFGGSWMDVGTRERSNSANLYTLVRTGYETLDDLACAGNAKAARGLPDPDAWDWRSMNELSYSYRIMPSGGMRISLRVPTTDSVVVATDRSPVTLRVSQGLPIIPEANSPNHNGRGQFVLRLDGSSSWETSPVVGGDNIWLPRPLEDAIRAARVRLGLIKGNEMPDSPSDAFVGP